MFHDKLNLTNSLVRSKLDSINNEILELDQRMQNIHLVKLDRRKPPQLPHIPAPPESDTEHIYETIPESGESEIEPIYSCPYEANKEENLIEQWLKAQDSNWKPKMKESTSREIKDNSKDVIKEKAKCKSSKSNSSGEEHENSSSAYNTGGSCNSNPLTFELAYSVDTKQKDTCRSTLILCQPPGPEEPPKKQDPNDNCDTCKGNVVGSKPKKSKSAMSKVNSPSSPTTRPGLSVPILSDTMYTNVANLQQTMLLQQQLLRQALSQTGEVAMKPTTSFTAPSLSQYQFGVTSHHQVYFKNLFKTTLKLFITITLASTNFLH